MITFSNKTIHESYLYEVEGIHITGEVDYNTNGFNTSMNITTDDSNTVSYGNISYDGTINITSPTSEAFTAASGVVNTFYEELKVEIEKRNK